MKIDDEVRIHSEGRAFHREFFQTHSGSVSLIPGANSSVEHHESLHFRHEGEMSPGGHGRGRPDGLWRRFLLRQSAQQAHAAEGWCSFTEGSASTGWFPCQNADPVCFFRTTRSRNR